MTQTFNQQPTYTDLKELNAKKAKLAEKSKESPIATVEEINALKEHLEKIKQGDGIAIIAGPCAETLGMATTPGYVENLFTFICNGAEVIQGKTGLPVTKILRAGVQMAKPRSQATETTADGNEVVSYFGDMINQRQLDKREPEPALMVAAYEAGLITAEKLRELCEASQDEVYLASEAMLLPFEESVTHEGHNASGHMKWIGNRTNDPDGAHIALAGKTKNPIGVKIGPGMTPETLREILDKAKPDILIFRMEAGTGEELGALLDVLTEMENPPVLCCDPMHGNTYKTPEGIKTRDVSAIAQTTVEFIKACCERQLHPGAFMFEVSPYDDVQECIGFNVDETNFANNYHSVCDPTLNKGQFEFLIETVAKQMQENLPRRQEKIAVA